MIRPLLNVYLSKQFLIFLVFGGSAAAINLLLGHIIYDAHPQWHVPYWAAVIFSAFCGMVANFVLNYFFNFTFRHRHWWQQLRTFCVISVIGILLTAALADLLLGIFTRRETMHFLNGLISARFASHFLAVGIVTFYSYAAHRAFSFNVGLRARLGTFLSKKQTPACESEVASRHAEKIEDIQFLRGVAIVAVLAIHFSLINNVISKFHLSITNPFYAGVELFFVISGFVVMRSLMRAHFNPHSFLMRRVLRLYPPMLVFFIITFLTNYLFVHVATSDWGRSSFAIPNDVMVQKMLATAGGYFVNLTDNGGNYFGPIWSLSVEFQFYAVLWIVVFALSVFRAAGGIIVRIITASAAFVFGLSVVARFLLFCGHPLHGWDYIIGCNFDFIALGVLLAIVPQERLDSLLSSRGRWMPLVSLTLPWVALAFCQRPEQPFSPLVGWGSLAMIGAMFAFGVAVAFASTGKNYKVTHGWVRQTLLYMGDRSYTIYLLHYPCMHLTWFVMFKLTPWALMGRASVYTIMQILMTAFVGLPIVELTFRFIEKPVIALGADLVRRWSKKMEQKEIATW